MWLFDVDLVFGVQGLLQGDFGVEQVWMFGGYDLYWYVLQVSVVSFVMVGEGFGEVVGDEMFEEMWDDVVGNVDVIECVDGEYCVVGDLCQLQEEVFQYGVCLGVVGYGQGIDFCCIVCVYGDFVQGIVDFIEGEQVVVGQCVFGGDMFVVCLQVLLECEVVW